MPHPSPRFFRANLMRASLIAALASLLGGCAVGSEYPSLSPRPIEDVSLAEPAPPPPPAGTPSAEATARYAPMVEQAQAADAGFRRALADARPALVAGRKAAEGSDAWLAGQGAFTRVEATRTPVTTALSDLDAERNGPEPREDSGLAAAVARAYAVVQTIDAAEAQALDGVWPQR